MSCEEPSTVLVILMYSGSLRGLSLRFTLILQGMISPFSKSRLPFSISYSKRVIDPLLLRDPSSLLPASPLPMIWWLPLRGSTRQVSSFISVSVILICMQEEDSILPGERAFLVTLEQAQVLREAKVNSMCCCSTLFFNLFMGRSIFFAAWMYGRAFRLINAHILFSINLVYIFLNMACSIQSSKISLSYRETVLSDDSLSSGKRKNCLSSWKEQLFRLTASPASKLARSRACLWSYLRGDFSCLFIVVFVQYLTKLPHHKYPYPHPYDHSIIQAKLYHNHWQIPQTSFSPLPHLPHSSLMYPMQAGSQGWHRPKKFLYPSLQTLQCCLALSRSQQLEQSISIMLKLRMERDLSWMLALSGQQVRMETKVPQIVDSKSWQSRELSPQGLQSLNPAISRASERQLPQLLKRKAWMFGRYASLVVMMKYLENALQLGVMLQMASGLLVQHWQSAGDEMMMISFFSGD